MTAGHRLLQREAVVEHTPGAPSPPPSPRPSRSVLWGISRHRRNGLLEALGERTQNNTREDTREREGKWGGCGVRTLCTRFRSASTGPGSDFCMDTTEAGFVQVVATHTRRTNTHEHTRTVQNVVAAQGQTLGPPGPQVPVQPPQTRVDGSSCGKRVDQPPHGVNTASKQKPAGKPAGEPGQPGQSCCAVVPNQS